MVRQYPVLISAATAGLLFQPSASFASIPPSVSLVVLSEDPRAEALSRAYVEFLSAGQNFVVAGPPESAWRARACLRKRGDSVSCVGRELKAGPLNRQAPPVVVVAQPRAGGVYWLCVGVDPSKVGKTSKGVLIDVKKALFGTPDTRGRQRAIALGCIFGAAAEADGIIRQ